MKFRLLAEWPEVDALTVREVVGFISISYRAIWDTDSLLLKGGGVIVPLKIQIRLAAGASVCIRSS